MIHAYNKDYLFVAQEKLAAMFEIIVVKEGVDIDTFAQKFIASPISKAFEKADPVYVLGKSANELLGIVLNKAPLDVETGDYATPEYWVGWVLAYAQWYFNRSYQDIISQFPCSKLLNYYFPYHEMDIMKSMELIRSRIDIPCPLKEMRTKCQLSQSQLALMSGVNIRTIKAYEQGTVDIVKAQAETLYALAQSLHCSIEDLIL